MDNTDKVKELPMLAYVFTELQPISGQYGKNRKYLQKPMKARRSITAAMTIKAIRLK